MDRISTHLWFDHQAEQAAGFYCGLFPDSRIDAIVRSPVNGPDGERAGVLQVEFTLAGRSFMEETFLQADAFLLGRTTCDLMQPCAGNAVGVALNTLPKHVATHRPASLTWQPSHPLDGDVRAAVEALKCKPGRELQVHGSHGLVQSLLRANLVDRFNLITFPVIVGAGKRLFGDGVGDGTGAIRLRRLSGRVTSTGATIAVHEPDGALALEKAFEMEGGQEAVR